MYMWLFVRKTESASLRRFYFENRYRKLNFLMPSRLTPVDVSLPPFISFAHSRILAASPPLLFLSAWKDGCSGGGEKLRPGALPELRGGLFVSGAIRSGAGSTRDDFPADGEVSAGHQDRWGIVVGSGGEAKKWWKAATLETEGEGVHHYHHHHHHRDDDEDDEKRWVCGPGSAAVNWEFSQRAFSLSHRLLTPTEPNF